MVSRPITLEVQNEESLFGSKRIRCKICTLGRRRRDFFHRIHTYPSFLQHIHVVILF